MKRGPAPTPTEILKMRGSRRAERRKGEPKPDKGRPRCPSWLKGNAKTEWKRLVEMLDRMGILTKVDGNALSRYCRLWQRWRRAEDFIEEHGTQYPVKKVSGTGKERKTEVVGFRMFPEAKLASVLSVELRRLECEFGLTPASRTRISEEATQAGAAVSEPHKSRFFKKTGA